MVITSAYVLILTFAWQSAAKRTSLCKAVDGSRKFVPIWIHFLRTKVEVEQTSCTAHLLCLHSSNLVLN